MAKPSEKTPLTKEQDDSPSTFSTSVGAVLTCLGCAVGTGNIWRFPRMLALNSGKSGALCFMLPWSLFLFIWSVPMLVIEYGTGRYTKQGVVTSLQKLMGDKAVWCGMWIAAVCFMIGSWYHVIMGWCILYTYRVVFHPLPRTYDESNQLFTYYVEDSYWPVLTQFIGIFVVGVVMLKNIKVIEKCYLLMVPLLLIILIAVFVWSLTRQGALRGLKFIFTPDWATLGSARLWMDAASQNAFDTNAGWGIFLVLASAMKANEPVIKYSLLIPLGNNIISVICGILMFSTAFSSLPNDANITSSSQIVDILQTSGPASTGLTFIWLPVLFASAHLAGRVFASLFFAALVIAALSSMIGVMEVVVEALVNYGVSRIYSVISVISACFLLGLASSISMDFLTNQDFTWAYALLLNGLMLQVMVIMYGATKFREHVINEVAPRDWHVPRIWDCMVKYLGPLQVFCLLGWWIADTIISSKNNEQAWYTFGRETLLSVIIQWAGLFVILIAINAALIFFKPSWFTFHSTNGSSQLMEEHTDEGNESSPVSEKTTSKDKNTIHLADIKKT